MLPTGGSVDTSAGRGRSVEPGPGIVTQRDVSPCLASPGWHINPAQSQAVITVDDLIHMGMEQVVPTLKKSLSLKLSSYFHLDEITVSRNNLLETLAMWGPSYKISMDLYINSFDGPNLKNGKLAELIRLTTTNGNCCGIGDRIPAIFTNKRGFIQVGTQIGSNGNKWTNVNLNARSWYKLDLMQYVWSNKVLEVTLNQILFYHKYYFSISLR